VNASTPAGNPATDTPTDPTDRHGDVDRNGDLVDTLDDRLRSAIDDTAPSSSTSSCAASSSSFRPWTVRL
jgi:hypothetical protein